MAVYQFIIEVKFLWLHVVKTMDILVSPPNYDLHHENSSVLSEELTVDDEDTVFFPLSHIDEYDSTGFMPYDTEENTLTESFSTNNCAHCDYDDYYFHEFPTFSEAILHTNNFTDLIPESDNVRSDELITKTEEKELIKAAADSLCQGNCLPIIKQELKAKIQLRRMVNGEKELVTGNSDKKDEKILKNVRKREKTRELNRLASLRSREKKSTQEKQLQEKVKRLVNLNDILIKERTALQKEVKDLEGKLKNCSESDKCLFISLTMHHSTP